MKFIADFHIHSKYSRATARNLDLENLYISAQIKGISVIGTGDFTHPAWWREIQEKLTPAEEGLFQLNSEIARACDKKVPLKCRRPIRFMLVTEISNIYKKAERTRKNHNLVFMPDMDSAAKLNRRLDGIGNITSDGRPILGLDARNLLEIILETDEYGYLIPAHIWTPWFSLLGSKSGFDSVDECFEDLSSHVFALETGLSSDPPMNWRVSHLDRYTLISNSDAHSPSKLGREANRFDTELNFNAIRKAMETGDPNKFLGTLEFYPEEGKYHIDGHRKCNFRSDPIKTRKLNGECPVCGKALTLGVLYRVEELADRDMGTTPAKASAYRNLIPLYDLLSEVLQVGVKTKKVTQAYHKLIETHGSEFDILCNIAKEDLNKSNIPLLAEAVIRMREGRVVFEPGYDGEFGRVRIFDPSERESLQGQQSMFNFPIEQMVPVHRPTKREPARTEKPKALPRKSSAIQDNLFPQMQASGFQLNAQQQAAVDHDDGPLLICAGPGTGKTRTITCRVSALVDKKGVCAKNILAVTFTNKASQEMRHRLESMLPAQSTLPLVATFHGFCWQLLQDRYNDQAGTIIDEVGRRSIVGDAIQMAKNEGHNIQHSTDTLVDMIVEAKQQLLGPIDKLCFVTNGESRSQLVQVYTRYQALLALQKLFDFEDLLFRVVQLLDEDESWNISLRNRFKHIFVDEFQDINFGQYRLLKALSSSKSNVCVIGDPDQAIYGFRGSDMKYFKTFTEDYQNPRIIQLTRNYRSTETILAASYQVIRNHQADIQLNSNRRIHSRLEGKTTISVMEAPSSRAEAVTIGRTIEKMMGGMAFHSIDFDKVELDEMESVRGFSDFAVLCRTGDQVQTITQQLITAGIPCQMVSRRVFEQPEIAKLLAAFRVVTSQGAYTDVDLLTDLSTPGISKETLGIFKQWAYSRQLHLDDARHLARRLPIPNMSTGRQQRLVALIQLLDRLQIGCEPLRTVEALDYIVKQTTLSSKIEGDELEQLGVFAQPFGKDKQSFCTALAIDRDTDLYEAGVENVSIMTMHAAKGLEFPVVFIAGCENGFIPYNRPGKNDSDPEEERRLFYVGMTRARQELILTWAKKRTIYGQSQSRKLSAFVNDIEEDIKSIIMSQFKPKQAKQEQLSLF